MDFHDYHDDPNYIEVPNYVVIIETAESVIEISCMTDEAAIEHFKKYLPLFQQLVESKNILLCTFDWFGQDGYILQSFITTDPLLVYNFFVMMNGKIRAGTTGATETTIYKVSEVPDYKVASEMLYALHQNDENQNKFLDASTLSKIHQN